MSATDSSPMKSAPMTNACAMPSGRACVAYSMRSPSRLPSPSNRRNWSWSSGVVMIRNSETPALIKVASG